MISTVCTLCFHLDSLYSGTCTQKQVSLIGIIKIAKPTVVTSFSCLHSRCQAASHSKSKRAVSSRKDQPPWLPRMMVHHENDVFGEQEDLLVIQRNFMQEKRRNFYTGGLKNQRMEKEEQLITFLMHFWTFLSVCGGPSHLFEVDLKSVTVVVHAADDMTQLRTPSHFARPGRRPRPRRRRRRTPSCCRGTPC